MNLKSNTYKLFPVLFSFFIMGFCDIVGFSSDYAQSAFGWSNTTTGFIPSMVFVWFLFLGIPIGTKMNHWGRKNTVLISMVVTIAGMAVPLVHYNGTTVILAYSLLGIGNAILQVSLNPLLSNVVPNQKYLTSSLTAGQVVKAVSSLLGPMIVLLAVNQFGNGENGLWYYSFPILGALTLLSAVWLLITPIPREVAPKEVEGSSLFGTLSLLKNKKILILFFGIFFVVGVDVATNFISSKIMIARFDWDKPKASIAPQVYFLSRTIGALLGAFIMTKIAEIKYFKLNIILAVLVGVVLAFVKIELVNLAAIGAIGFLASCIFPIIYSMAVQVKPRNANQISGLMITAVAGGGAFTPLIGLATDIVGIIGGVFVIIGCILYLAYCAFGIQIEK